MPKKAKNSSICTVKVLRSVAERVRNRLLTCDAEEGSCEPVSEALVKALKKRGCDAWATYGTWRGHPHMWVRSGPYFVDATHDQFRHYAATEEEENWFYDNPILIGRGVGPP